MMICCGLSNGISSILIRQWTLFNSIKMVRMTQNDLYFTKTINNAHESCDIQFNVDFEFSCWTLNYVFLGKRINNSVASRDSGRSAYTRTSLSTSYGHFYKHLAQRVRSTNSIVLFEYEFLYGYAIFLSTVYRENGVPIVRNFKLAFLDSGWNLYGPYNMKHITWTAFFP